RERVDVGGGKFKSEKKLEPRPEAVTALPAAAQAYYGGRNECFLVGIHDGPWIDLDISSAYPSAMALIPDPDFTVPPRVLAAGELRPSDVPMPVSYLFGYVEFAFPELVMFPCLPCKDALGRGLIFPKRGKTWASAPELYLALRMGARVTLLQPAKSLLRATPSVCARPTNHLWACVKKPNARSAKSPRRTWC
ncbi:DNA-directed DNA polymerase, partial [mine drainage metagenome]